MSSFVKSSTSGGSLAPLPPPAEAAAPSALLSRLQAFLPALAAANALLPTDCASLGDVRVDDTLEAVGEGSGADGKDSDDGDSDDSDEDDDDGDSDESDDDDESDDENGAGKKVVELTFALGDFDGSGIVQMLDADESSGSAASSDEESEEEDDPDEAAAKASKRRLVGELLAGGGEARHGGVRVEGKAETARKPIIQEM